LFDLFFFFPSFFFYLIAFGKPAGHREVAPREFDVHSRWKPAREQKRRRRRIIIIFKFARCLVQ